MLDAVRPSGYSKRHQASIPAPQEDDSDPEFKTGTYVPETTLKRKRNSASTSSFPRKRIQAQIRGADSSGQSASRRKTTVFSHRKYGSNPLLEYFNKGLGLHSQSENETYTEQDDDEDEDGNSDKEEPIVLKSFTKYERQRSQGLLVATTSSSTEVVEGRTDEQDSVTEPESDVEPHNDHEQVKQVSNKKFANGGRDSESVTEPETEDEISHTNRQLTSPGKRLLMPSSGSETEPESDTELLADQRLDPRPGFPLAPGQRYLGPLILDKDRHMVVSASINTYLRDYQREGVKFFWTKYDQGRGGLLGDDMGLGKTIQVISFLSAIMQKTGVATDVGRRRKHVSLLQDSSEWKKFKKLPPANATWPTCLIIAPSTVVHNWQREFETWGYFEVGMYNGDPKEREPVLRDFQLGRLDVVLTTFDLARRDIDLLDTLPWSCIFVDEVHRVKNEGAKITQAYHRFECTRRFGLTGTTIQNSYKEMWTILDWTNPGRLGTGRQWNGYVVKPLTTGQSAAASEEERAKALEVALILRDELLPGFFLRRTKDIIKDQLPQKSDQVVFCPLTAKQVAVYKNILTMPAVQNLVLKDKKCPCGSGKRRKACCFPSAPGDVFRFMSILIKLSNHLALILPSPTDSAEQLQRNRSLAQLAFPEDDVPKYGTAILQSEYCGKWGVLELLLREWRKDPTNKVLIFTKSVKLLDMLDFHLNTQSFGFLRLDGNTKQSERMPMIDQFHHDPKVFIFLISTLAGGTGLNLTGANKVVIFDPNWNPAHDLQAMDRAFRFGQTRNVNVYRLLGAGSIEELIYARQIYKQQQMAIGYEASVQTRYFQGVQGDNSKKGELFGIKNIFKLHEDTLATKMAIEKATLAELDWALANMSGSRTGKQGRTNSEDWIESEKSSKEKDETSLQGLGALLFDDEPIPSTNREEDLIKQTLNAIGVKYSHHNDKVLVPSRIEEERLKTLLKGLKQKSKVPIDCNKNEPTLNKKSPKKPKAQWPPVRKTHQRPPSPGTQLASRRRALIELGMINGPDDIAAFAREFATQIPDEQKKILAQLDLYTRQRSRDSDSD